MKHTRHNIVCAARYKRHSPSISAANARRICGDVIPNKRQVAASRCFEDVGFAFDASGGSSLQNE